jgi:hypothetical protein
MSDKEKWVMQMPIQELLALTEFLDKSELDVLEKPALLIFATEEDEYSIEGFNTLEEAKEHMENEYNPAEGYYLEDAYYKGKEMEWTEVKRFDFREKKVP